MGETSSLDADRDITSDLEERLSRLATLACGLSKGAECAIAWASANGEGIVAAPDKRAAAESPLRSTLAMLARRMTPADEIVTLTTSDLKEIVTGPGSQSRNTMVAGTSIVEGKAAVRVALRYDSDLDPTAIKVSLEAIARAALIDVSLDHLTQSREFWRQRASDATQRIASLEAELERSRAASRELHDAHSAASKLAPQQRYAGAGALIAAAGGFDGWILALKSRGQTRVVSASEGIALQSLGADSELAEFAVGSTADHTLTPDRSVEQRVFKRPYVCIPLDGGAIALASRGPISEDARLRAQAIAVRLEPLLRSWIVEEEAAEYRALVAKLALRMFAAIDDERARIARDLHDDQAQLLAAAQIALEGGREQARGILHRLEQELRKRTRALRPATLGRLTLFDALEKEFERLAEAGVAASLTRGANSARIGRPLQQLCFQIAREAFSNVIRHASASSVEVRIERQGGLARISIADNGRGIGRGTEGSGLAGMRERVELMGGTLRIDSSSRGTIVTAEIPEPA